METAMVICLTPHHILISCQNNFQQTPFAPNFNMSRMDQRWVVAAVAGTAMEVRTMQGSSEGGGGKGSRE